MFKNLINNRKKEENLLLSLILSFFPLAFILGNTIINLTLIFFILISLYSYRSLIFKLRYSTLDKLIFSFFALIVFSGILNDIKFYIEQNDFSVWRGPIYTTIKSIFFLRFFLLYLIIKFLIENKKINLKFFFISASFFSLFVCLDIFIQSIFGKDLFGYIASGRKLSGPFGEELIAGSYIQRFSLFAFFVLFFFHKKLKTKNFIIINIILLLIFLLGIILAGNRIPTLLFILAIFLIFLTQRKLIRFLLPISLIFIIVFSIIYNTNKTVSANFGNFKLQLKQITTFLVSDKKELNKAPSYIKQFSTFHETWLMNKYFGGGIKNFRYHCHKRPNIKPDFNLDTRFEKRQVCNMHPHNYYLEILTETGIFGLFILLAIFIKILLLNISYKNFFKLNVFQSYQLLPFFILFIVEIFPIKSTGSFFTTANATYIFLILSITIASLKKYNLIAKTS